MNYRKLDETTIVNSNPSAKLINAVSVELFDKGFSNYQNRPRRKVFNIEVAQAIRQNPAQSIRNRMGTSVRKIKTGDIA